MTVLSPAAEVSKAHESPRPKLDHRMGMRTVLLVLAMSRSVSSSPTTIYIGISRPLAPQRPAYCHSFCLALPC